MSFAFIPYLFSFVLEVNVVLEVLNGTLRRRSTEEGCSSGPMARRRLYVGIDIVPDSKSGHHSMFA